MRWKHILLTVTIPMILFLGGCFEEDTLVPVQEYKGENYKVAEPPAFKSTIEKSGEIAEKNKGKVIAAVKKYYLTEFKTKVKVHNLVEASNGVVAYTESVGEPHFYSSVEVSIDTKKNEVKTDEIIVEDYLIESAINSGLYVMAYEEEFARLDELFEEIAQHQPIVGLNMEVVQNTYGYDYETPYYYVKVHENSLAEAYLENPNINKEEVRSLIEKEEFDSENNVAVVINLHMEEPDVEPDESIYDDIYERIEQAKGIPAGSYHLKLYSNYISQFYAIGDDSDSIDKTGGNPIIKK